MSPPTKPIKIAIIGAGPVSLTLANILQKHAVPFTVFEATPTLRTTGGTLDLHPKTGQLAMREAGLWDQFVKYARPECDVTKLLDIDGTVVYDENTTDKAEHGDGEEDGEGDGGEDTFEKWSKRGTKPEIDRKDLNELLYRGVKEGGVKFGKKLKEVVQHPSSSPDTKTPKFHLHFADGTTETDFDLVIGGEGAWSKVRNLLTDDKPRYSGITLVEMWCNDLSQNEWLKTFVGAGSMYAFGEGCAVQSLVCGDGTLVTYASLRVPEGFVETCGINFQHEDKARKEVVERYFSHTSSDVKRIIFESKDGFTPRKLYELPVGFTWAHRPGLTLIGDAAHVMTPFAGVGVNVGMEDSMMLAEEIVKACRGEKTLDEGLRAYEEGMFPRAKVNAEKTEYNKIGLYKAGGVQKLVNMMRGAYSQEDMWTGNIE